MTQSPIKVFIVDDHEIVRIGIRALLQQVPYMHVVGDAGSGDDALAQVSALRPDVVVMDIRMPGMSGVDACREIVAQVPEAKVIILTTYGEDELLFSAIRAGASGYVLKRIGNNDLVRTIQAVARGESALDPSLTAAVFREVISGEKSRENSIFAALSAQEMRVLALLSEGMTNREIARKLFLGEGTVRNYVSSILSKLNLSNRAEAAAFAVQHHAKDHTQSD
jgi:DNA-binding NarL/FixJ family response regulator